MTAKELGQTLRKYWYVAIIAIVAVGIVVHLLVGSGKSPAELLGEYGYILILVWTFLEGETIVIIAGALSKSVGLEPPIIALCAFCGSFLSDQVMFSLGKYKGEDVLRYFPRVAKNIDKAANLFKKYDTALILGFRFVYGVRNVTPILLGISGVSHKKFFALNFIGAWVWALTFTYGGLLAGEAFQRAMHTVGHSIFYILIAVIVLGAGLWYFRARHNVKAAKELAARCQEEAAQGQPLSTECANTAENNTASTGGNTSATGESASLANESDSTATENTAPAVGNNMTPDASGSTTTPEASENAANADNQKA